MSSARLFVMIVSLNQLHCRAYILNMFRKRVGTDGCGVRVPWDNAVLSEFIQFRCVLDLRVGRALSPFVVSTST